MKTEIALNLWGYLDASLGLIYAVSGRAYALGGEEDEKLETLRQLSANDYVLAPRRKLSSRFGIHLSDGTVKHGVAHPATFKDELANPFEELFQDLEKELPPLLVLSELGSRTVKQTLPKNPLYVWTLLYESESGDIRPIVSQEDRDWCWEQEILRGRGQ